MVYDLFKIKIIKSYENVYGKNLYILCNFKSYLIILSNLLLGKNVFKLKKFYANGNLKLSDLFEDDAN